MNYSLHPNPTLYRPIFFATKKLGSGKRIVRQEPIGQLQGFINKSKLPVDAKFRALNKYWDAEEMFAEKGFLAKKRFQREIGIRQWKNEMNNTAKMALWFKFRYEAAKYNPKSDDAKKYRAYKRLEARQRADLVKKKTETHDEFTLDMLIEQPERMPVLDMFDLESQIARINGKYIEWVGEEFNDRKVYHCSSRDTYISWGQKSSGQWCWRLTLDDPREVDNPEIFAVTKASGSASSNIIGGRRRDDQTNSYTWVLETGEEETIDTQRVGANQQKQEVREQSMDNTVKRLNDLKSRQKKFLNMSVEEYGKSKWTPRKWWIKDPNAPAPHRPRVTRNTSVPTVGQTSVPQSRFLQRLQVA